MDVWYAGLVAPVRGALERGLDDVRGVVDCDPWTTPRTGLGGAVALHVAGLGRSRSRKAERVAVASLETWNQRVHQPGRVSFERALARDADAWMSAWSRWIERNDGAAARVIDRLVPAWTSDAIVPEGVVFLRASVAAGVLAGQVDDALHARLDRWATWCGLAWEARHGRLDRARWDGALLAASLEGAWSDAPFDAAVLGARAELSDLLEHRGARALDALVGEIPEASAVPREPDAWRPMRTPASPALARKAARSPEDSPLDVFAAQWSPAIDQALSEVPGRAAPSLDDAVQYVHRQGGKRLRPLLVLAAVQACGGEPRWALREAALVEWLHRTSLIVDDVLDGSSLRRGEASLHSATSVPFALGVALHLVGCLERETRNLPAPSRACLADAGATLAHGEWRELRATGRPALGETAYHRIVEAKTARLFACAARLGGIAAGAPPRALRALGKAGREAGIAFQIVDDLLDVVGDEATLGKSPGTDLRARKVTLPTLLLRPRLRPSERARLDALIAGAREVTEQDVAWLRAHTVEEGVDEACRARATQHLGRASEHLALLPDAEGAALVRALFTRCVERSA